ncbi:sensor histidine kinase [Daejeonella oryzae]|uniref:sensor histidine kinase n=1 Tax=Daejeonella oryzae TaxID=1122943 RepID=UPI0003F81DEF|nr:histidine kinase [Daejeonella oryzae]
MNKTKQIFLHSAIWISILLLFIYIGSNGKYTYHTLVVIVYFGLINILIFYINYLLILPKFLNKKRYWWCAVSMILLVFSAALIKYGLASIFKDFILIRGPKKVLISFYDYYLSAVFVSSFFIFLSTALKFMADWFENEKVKTNLENEKLTAELAFLKSQINPHFLFNSLNNIYSLAYQKSAKTPEAILKLSEIMRYMLYESNDNMVSLAKEIRYLENYIELQKLRFKDESFVHLDISGDPENQTIMPLVLISFVENAFKHGVATDEKSPIRITIKIESGKLFFRVINRKSDFNKDETGGIGLLNVHRRLDLIYKDKYKLTIDNSTDYYSCVLNLEL